MAFRRVSLERVPSQGEMLTISKSGLTFGAFFIKNNLLDKKRAVSFFFDDQDPYVLGFDFHDEPGGRDTLSLVSSDNWNGATRSVKATELINKSKVLTALQKDPVKANRIFPIQRHHPSNIFFVSLRPSFEHRVHYERRSEIPEGSLGIYRYSDQSGRIIYIGKGNIRDRAFEADRKDWGIVTIEYSILISDDAAYRWESYYIERFQNDYGTIPLFNRIKGRSNWPTENVSDLYSRE
jgi:hypothetical protein